VKVIASLAAVGVLFTAACSSPASNTTAASPSVSFQSGMTPGMSGQAMPGMSGSAMPAMSGMQSPPASASATTADSPASQGGTAVSITNFKFNPTTLTVPVGATVTWTNQDEEPHSVAGKDGSFHSPGMDTHGTYSFTFTTPGSYDYICSIHPFMTGTVVVTK
jgi:amicyanin